MLAGLAARQTKHPKPTRNNEKGMKRKVRMTMAVTAAFAACVASTNAAELQVEGPLFARPDLPSPVEFQRR